MHSQLLTQIACWCASPQRWHEPPQPVQLPKLAATVPSGLQVQPTSAQTPRLCLCSPFAQLDVPLFVSLRQLDLGCLLRTTRCGHQGVMPPQLWSVRSLAAGDAQGGMLLICCCCSHRPSPPTVASARAVVQDSYVAASAQAVPAAGALLQGKAAAVVETCAAHVLLWLSRERLVLSGGAQAAATAERRCGALCFASHLVLRWFGHLAQNAPPSPPYQQRSA